ncbi:hypothetical protein ACWCY6_28250 [Streptomyces sp. 900105755]
MNSLPPWRIELLRIARTRRLLVLGALYLFLGASGPLLARYSREIFSRLSGSSTVTITVAAPRPADGILGFYKSAMQMGLIACVVITGLAVCIDSRAALSVFYRTRSRAPRLLAPRLTVTLVTTAVAYSIGFMFAWYETYALIGAPAVATTVQSWALGLCYTAFAVMLTFIVSAFFRTTLGVVGTTIVLIILMPIIGGIKTLAPYLPSLLVTLPTDLYQEPTHRSPTSALLVTLAVSIVGGAVALRLIARRRVAR